MKLTKAQKSSMKYRNINVIYDLLLRLRVLLLLESTTKRDLALMKHNTFNISLHNCTQRKPLGLRKYQTDAKPSVMSPALGEHTRQTTADG